MSGRFSQYHTRDDYIRVLEMDDDIARDTNTIRRYNVAPGTRVLILRARDEKLRFDPVYRGYVPEWWDKAPLINVRVENAATGRMFKSLWNSGRAVVPADGWYECAQRRQKTAVFHLLKKQ